jgi:hypothetical protein
MSTSIGPALSDPAQSQSLREALAQLRLRLLDLTGRNRLLNYKHPAGKSLQFVEGQPAALYEKLADGKVTVVIKGLPEPTRADLKFTNGRWLRPDPREWATQKGIPVTYDLSGSHETQGDPHLRALLYLDDLAKHCRKIERESILAIEETGANMLYLVLGFLDFPDQRDSDRLFSGPLLSIPVVLSKREFAGNQVFSIRHTGDEVTENLSLREKLRQDHGLTLPELDEEELDVESYFASINKVIRSRPNFTLRPRVSLCLLSFTNMLLVRDLNPENWPDTKNGNGLLDHSIVKQVFGSGEFGGENLLASAAEYPVEEEPAKSVPLVFDADSSQHSALVDVLSSKRNVVIQGPPGTGKSQTITNLIAASLAQGRRVLFVAEKLAALDVVRNRLAAAGLDPFILELHSTKSSKKHVLEQIAKRLEFRPNAPIDLPKKIQEAETYRAELAAYAQLLNTVLHNQFGLSLHQIMWRAERQRRRLTSGESILTQTNVGDATEITDLELSRRMESLEHLSAQYRLIGDFGVSHPFWGFLLHPMVPGDELRLQKALESLFAFATRFVSEGDALSKVIASGVALTLEQLTAVRDTLKAFVGSTDEQLPLHLIGDFLRIDSTAQFARREVEKLTAQLQSFHRLEKTVETGLLNEALAAEDRLRQLHESEKTAERFGCKCTSISDLQQLAAEIQPQIERLSSALASIRDFCRERQVQFDSTGEQLERLCSLTQTIAEVPEEHLGVQSDRLAESACIPALESLHSLQEKWYALETELANSLYLDEVIDEASLKRAILRLREGDRWYRFLQPSWHSAVGFHKRLQRQKTKMSASARLDELHQIVDLGNFKQRWKNDPAWQKYLGCSPPGTPFSLFPHLAVAKWNKAVSFAIESLGVQALTASDVKPSTVRQLCRDFAGLQNHLEASLGSMVLLNQLIPGINARNAAELVSRAGECVAYIERHALGFSLDVPAQASIGTIVAAFEAALERRRLAALVEANDDVRKLLKDEFRGVRTDSARVLACVAVAEQVSTLPIPSDFRNKLLTGNCVSVARQIINTVDPVLTSLRELEQFTRQMGSFGEFSLEGWVGARVPDDLVEFTKRLSRRTSLAASNIESAGPWSIYISRRNESKALGLVTFIDLIERGDIVPGELSGAYAYATLATIVRTAFRYSPQLGKFSGLKHSRVRDEFRRLDREIIQMRGKDIAEHCSRAARPPGGNNGPRVDDKTEMVLLHHLVPQQRPRMPVRKMLNRAGRAAQSLKPCFMMGPQAVAQYLSPGAMSFDLIVMDEASQLKPEEAIGAIARGAQVVVVGDPKQLPPTSFFTRMIQIGEDEEQFTTTDAQSILDVCLSHFRPPRDLRWHYRSQHHSLIAFSNHYFYRNNLIVFPSPYGHSSKLGVRATYIPDAVYEDQTNFKEALRVVSGVIDHIKSRPGESLGVVTLNLKQRDLIAELIEERLQNVPGSDSYREAWTAKGQPLFIKNLENVQGDERDAIIISTTFGKPTGSDVVRQNFGPISRQGGWRRLNVLFTRARKSVALFTSLRPEDIVVEGSTPDGTKALRNYLEYVRTGQLNIPEETGIDPDSDFEVAVIDFLKEHGYEVTPQLGVAGYRIDIAVKHPDFPGAYLAAIECDGASYHSAISVRDRDRIRQEILESMGWRDRIWRIWSTDWFRTPRQESEKLFSFLNDLRKTWKPEHSSGNSWIELGKNGAAESRESSQEVAAIRSTLFEFDDESTVRMGDLVRYVDLKNPEDVLTVRITENTTDLSAGLVHRGTPLAHTLLGAIVGDEVTMHLPGASARTFRILEIKREDV